MSRLENGGSMSIAYLSLIYLSILDANTTNYLGDDSDNLEKVEKHSFVDQPK